MAPECLNFIFSSASPHSIAPQHCPVLQLRQILQVLRDPVPAFSAGDRAVSATCTSATRPGD